MLNKGTKGKHETLCPRNSQSRHCEKAFSAVPTQKSFAPRALASAEQKSAEAPGHPLCSDPAVQAARGHGGHLKSPFSAFKHHVRMKCNASCYDLTSTPGTTAPWRHDVTRQQRDYLFLKLVTSSQTSFQSAPCEVRTQTFLVSQKGQTDYSFPVLFECPVRD